MATPLKRFYIVALYRNGEYVMDTRANTLSDAYVAAHHWMNEPNTHVEIHGPFKPVKTGVRVLTRRPGAGFQTRQDARRQHRNPKQKIEK